MTFIYYQLQLKSKHGIIIPCCYLSLTTSTELEVVTVWEQWCAPARIYLRLDVKLSKIAQETSSLTSSSCLRAFLSCSLVHSNYSFSSSQRSPWGQEKVPIAERWPVHRGLNKSQCMDCPPKKVAIVGRWPVRRGLNKGHWWTIRPPKSGRSGEVAVSGKPLG